MSWARRWRRSSWSALNWADELSDREELAEDVALIREQADRCRDILRSMGRAGKDDLHLKNLPVGAVVREAAEPHQDRGIELQYDVAPLEDAPSAQPVIRRSPEIVHGLRNLIQNAVDFAREGVWVEVSWDATQIVIRVVDDGPGFPPQVLGRIGDPFVRQRRGARAQAARPEYEGMGLGLFIAKTLLERTGAELSFANGRDPSDPMPKPGAPKGAIVDVVWQRQTIEAAERDALGENVRIGP